MRFTIDWRIKSTDLLHLSFASMECEARKFEKSLLNAIMFGIQFSQPGKAITQADTMANSLSSADVAYTASAGLVPKWRLYQRCSKAQMYCLGNYATPKGYAMQYLTILNRREISAKDILALGEKAMRKRAPRVIDMKGRIMFMAHPNKVFGNMKGFGWFWGKPQLLRIYDTAIGLFLALSFWFPRGNYPSTLDLCSKNVEIPTTQKPENEFPRIRRRLLRSIMANSSR